MAKGRFVSKQITIDKKVNDLKDPWSMLGFTWMIPHADCEGRLYGDPAVLKSIIFPRQNGNITIEQIEEYIFDWQDSELIVYYEDDNDKYIQLINFEKHQTGLRKDRETESNIPGFNPDTCRILSGKNRVKLSISKVKDKLKGIEVNTPATPTNDNFVLQTYSKVTTFVAIPGDQQKVFDAIEAMRANYKTVPEMVEYLKPFYQEYILRRGVDGRPYQKTGHGWLDWAIAGEIPASKNDETSKSQSIQDRNRKVIEEALAEAKNGNL